MSHHPLDDLDDEAAFLEQEPSKTKYYIAYLMANIIILILFNGITNVGLEPFYPLRWEFMLILHGTTVYLLTHYTAPFPSLLYTLMMGTAFGCIAFMFGLLAILPLDFFAIRDVNSVKFGVSLMSCIFYIGFIRLIHRT